MSYPSSTKWDFGQVGQNVMLLRFRVFTCASLLLVMACGGDGPTDSSDSNCSIHEDACNPELDCGPSLCTDAASDLVNDNYADWDKLDELPELPDTVYQDIDAATGGDVPENDPGELPEGPVLILNPSDTLDFGMVGGGAISERIVVVTNNGTGDLEVTFEFPIDGDSANEFFCQTRFPLTIKSRESSEVPIIFTNKGVQSGEISLTMKINSNQPGHEGSSLTLHADHGQTKAACIPSLTPAQVDFGPVLFGSTNMLTVGISNTGSGFCTFLFLLMSDCELAGDSYNCPSPFDANDSSTFTLATDVSTIQKLIAPDRTLNLDIAFSPPTEGGQTAFAGLMLVRVADSTAIGSTITYDLPVQNPVEGYRPNLIGTVADSGE